MMLPPLNSLTLGTQLPHIFNVCTLCCKVKKDIRRMERTLSMNYPVLRQNKRVLLYTFVKNHSLYYFLVYIPSIYPFLPLVLMYSDEI